MTLDEALKRLQRLATDGAVEGNRGARNHAERLYGKAYQRLVSAGLRPQIRGKYR